MGLFGLNIKERAIWNTIRPGWIVKVIIRDRAQDVYFSRVISLEAAFLNIQIPMKGTLALEIPLGAQVLIEVVAPDGGQIKFITAIKQMGGGVDRATKLVVPRGLNRVQLRGAYRLEIVLDIKYSTLNDSEAQEKDLELRHTVFTGLTRDISEHGALIVINRQLDVNRFINMRVELSTGEIVRAKAKILRCQETIMKGKFLVAIHFEYLTNSDMGILSRYIFTQCKDRSSKEML